ncbi:hypothetical protein [Pseudorhodoferax sp. Leaf267]|uniref:hypothetical protein n=1 Tax=Pseudorhodoferax sp. Leaf267 TaxID=1736316 RepID=UPI0007020EC7|nr:hypothetical protein [Pseudorhodoferax sp. Leaf267]KQP17809.1 hypothetical protein ASF43_08015 [Pseudorhodoferax sp. Leaf267]
MRNTLDFSSWQGILSTLLGLVIVSLVAVGIRLLVMHSVQQRRERQNRQINERLKTLIAAYKTLGGSFTGNLGVDPRHLRELRLQAVAARAALDAAQGPVGAESAGDSGSERNRRIRDAVEAALSDVILLGTEEQVRLAAQAASDMVAGRTIETAALVASLRQFIREVLDLEAIPASVAIPKQGPVRAAGSGGRAGGQAAGAGRGGGGQGGGGGGGVMAAGGLLGLGVAGAPGADATGADATGADATGAAPQDERQP